MIHDSIKNIGRYKGMDPAIDRAIDYIQKTDFMAYEPGTHEIEGRDLYIIRAHADTKIASKTKYEYHKEYSDIQILLKGAERFEWAREEDITQRDEFNVEKDKGMVEADRSGLADLCDGEFVLFFPYELHKPQCSVDDTLYKVHKVTVKIKMEA